MFELSGIEHKQIQLMKSISETLLSGEGVLTEAPMKDLNFVDLDESDFWIPSISNLCSFWLRRNLKTRSSNQVMLVFLVHWAPDCRKNDQEAEKSCLFKKAWLLIFFPKDPFSWLPEEFGVVKTALYVSWNFFRATFWKFLDFQISFQSLSQKFSAGSNISVLKCEEKCMNFFPKLWANFSLQNCPNVFLYVSSGIILRDFFGSKF